MRFSANSVISGRAEGARLQPSTGTKLNASDTTDDDARERGHHHEDRRREQKHHEQRDRLDHALGQTLPLPHPKLPLVLCNSTRSKQ